MLTRAGYALLAASLILLVSGLPTGNLYTLGLSMLPLSFFLIGALSGRPRSVRLRLVIPDDPPRVGQPFTLTLEYEVEGGTGLLELHQPLPGVFERVDGQNLLVIPKHSGTLRGRHTFTVNAPRRGVFMLPPATWELVPALGMTRSAGGRSGEPNELHVRPGLVSFRRLNSATTRAATLIPENDEARLGTQTTDFRDIREYQRGDPPRTINWKATARMMARVQAARAAPTTAHATASTRPADASGPPSTATPTATATTTAPPLHVVPLVNEYEHEGRKSVWIYLDCGPHMRVGTSADNAFEQAVRATQGTARYFIDRGFRVGFTAYNRNEPLHIYADTGQRQMFRIREELAFLEPTTHQGGLPMAVEQTKRFLLQGGGLAVVVTRADVTDASREAGLRRLRGLLARRRRGRVPIMVVSPDPYGLVPDTHDGTAAARQIQRHLDQENLRQIRRLGVDLLHWDPKRVRFEALLAKRGGRG